MYQAAMQSIKKNQIAVSIGVGATVAVFLAMKRPAFVCSRYKNKADLIRSFPKDMPEKQRKEVLARPQLPIKRTTNGKPMLATLSEQSINIVTVSVAMAALTFIIIQFLVKDAGDSSAGSIGNGQRQSLGRGGRSNLPLSAAQSHKYSAESASDTSSVSSIAKHRYNAGATLQSRAAAGKGAKYNSDTASSASSYTSASSVASSASSMPPAPQKAKAATKSSGSRYSSAMAYGGM